MIPAIDGRDPHQKTHVVSVDDFLALPVEGDKIRIDLCVRGCGGASRIEAALAELSHVQNDVFLKVSACLSACRLRGPERGTGRQNLRVMILDHEDPKQYRIYTLLGLSDEDFSRVLAQVRQWTDNEEHIQAAK